MNVSEQQLINAYRILVCSKNELKDNTYAKEHLYTFLTYCVVTQDEHDKDNPYKPMPMLEKPHLRAICDEYVDNNLLLIVKSRQLMVSWLFCGIIAWDSLFYDGRLNIIISRKSEDADKLIKRIGVIYDRLPLTIKQFCPVKKTPTGETTSECKAQFLNGSKVIGLSQDADAVRSQTASNIFYDEMAFSENAQACYIASLPSVRGGGKLAMCSTPNGRNFFYRVFSDTITGANDDSSTNNDNIPNIKATELCNGLIRKKNPKNGVCTLSLHYLADPKFTTEYIKQAQQGYSKDGWEQEMELSFKKAGGTPVFNDFSYGKHVKPLQIIDRIPIQCGIDFGYHHPALTITQIGQEDVLYVLDELLGTDITIDEFARLMLKKIHAQYPIHYNNRQNMIEWFCDPAGTQVNDKSEFTSIQILRDKYRIFCRYRRVGKKQGIRIIQNKMVVRRDGRPGLIIDPRCKIIIGGFQGGYEEAASKDNLQSKEMPKDDDYYSHNLDALRYVCINKFNYFGSHHVFMQPTTEDEFDPYSEESATVESLQKQRTGYF